MEGWDQGCGLGGPQSRPPAVCPEHFPAYLRDHHKSNFPPLLTSEGRPFLPSVWEMYSIDGKAQCKPMSCRQPNIQHSGNDYPISRSGSRTAIPGSGGGGLGYDNRPGCLDPSRSPGLRQVRDRGGCCCQAPVWLRQSCRIRLSYERNDAPGAAQGLPEHRLG